MATKFFVDNVGTYIGGFDGAPAPVGAIEVPNPPEHALRFTWDGSQWIEDIKDHDQALKDVEAEKGVTVETMVEALWKKTVQGDSTEADALQIKRDEANAEVPKP